MPAYVITPHINAERCYATTSNYERLDRYYEYAGVGFQHPTPVCQVKIRHCTQHVFVRIPAQVDLY
jgi:hypothetical protein